MFQRLLKLSEISETTGLSEGTLISAINTGELRAAKIGKAWRLRSDDLAAWIDGKFSEGRGRDAQSD